MAVEWVFLEELGKIVAPGWHYHGRMFRIDRPSGTIDILMDGGWNTVISSKNFGNRIQILALLDDLFSWEHEELSSGKTQAGRSGN
ncbi:MAG: hypothetical protein G01um101448_791 [Parcubacteria group bacterium Gr01-1014_48]|nr:MAG: hypothetical protein Greene041614_82 [Parcubacteria group bacterium Greene0416_14]TSC73375.1 MAG: hypothetical protein G01um101448_791 [Parcubacteria group bacterium Gr01-1014_48]TSD01523.1 MAG: hypothetical protein Greene101415_239 [Parcubacteria group bacterium Greene1014_15]TSD08030.1 MAG: hypothetical protein Greene07144_478 [Parcubacteria group bacterium Greene0714_4]